jgi:ketosteroid isomerase-like protein
MKKIKNLFLLIILISVSSYAQAQENNEPGITIDHPNANETMEIVNDYVNLSVSGDIDKAVGLLAENYMGYGPGATDSLNVSGSAKFWKDNYTVQSDRSVELISMPVNITQTESAFGNLSGDWVQVWGVYSFTQNEMKMTLPFQMAAKIVDGEIANSRIYYDRLNMLQKLGYKMTPPAMEE